MKGATAVKRKVTSCKGCAKFQTIMGSMYCFINGEENGKKCDGKGCDQKAKK